jgi:hypothetical protein
MTNADIPTRQEYEVVKRTPRQDVVGIKIDGREFKFGQGNMFKTDDPGLARAIHDSQGQGGDGDVLVVPVEKPAERGHKRTFVVPALPWHKEN